MIVVSYNNPDPMVNVPAHCLSACHRQSHSCSHAASQKGRIFLRAFKLEAEIQLG